MEIKVIFLDIDGVLCIGKEIDRKCLENLKTILDMTSARIVLTSAWRYKKDCILLNLYIKSNVHFRFFPKSRSQVESALKDIGANCLLGWTSSRGKTRVDEIYHWLKDFDNKTTEEAIVINKWIAIDDMDLYELDKKRMQDHFVLTTASIGITEETVKQAIILLS